MLQAPRDSASYPGCHSLCVQRPPSTAFGRFVGWLIPGGGGAASPGAYSQGYARSNLTHAGTPDQSRQSLVDADVPDDFELSYPLLADYIFDRSALAKYVTAYAIILQQISVGTIALTLFGDMLAPRAP